MEEDITKLLETARKNCLRCHGYRRMGRTQPYKTSVLDSLRRMHNSFDLEHALLKRMAGSDRTPNSEIEKAKESRNFCLSAIHSCEGCVQEVDQVNRIMRQFGQI